MAPASRRFIQKTLQYGVTGLASHDFSVLKQQALLFDRLIVTPHYYFFALEIDQWPQHLRADFQYLKSRKFIREARNIPHLFTRTGPGPIRNITYFPRTDGLDVAKAWTLAGAEEVDATGTESLRHKIAVDATVRRLSIMLNEKEVESVPIYRTQFPSLVKESRTNSVLPRTRMEVLSVALDALPSPGQDSSWESILDLNEELHDKRWAFRRFLKTLATKEMTGPEIRDEIEWMVNEYSKAMEIHRIKASQSFVDVFIISPLEIIENLVKLNISKIAKGLLAVRKRKVELLEAEMNAPGRECAYVFDARRAFGE